MRKGGCENELGMQCNEHPHRNNPAGAICAFCLQHKLHNLLSSSSPLPFLPSSSPSPSSPSSPPPPSKNPFLLPNKNKPSTNPSSSAPPPNTIFKRSKSTATPRRNHLTNNYDDYNPRKRNGFWSFLYLSSSSSSSKPPASSKKPKENDKYLKSSSVGKKNEVVVEDDDSGDCYLERKVSRSRSVGCGSRSFSGDFFERISNGLGDCTLRRVESQRGPNRPKLNSCVKERVASSSSTAASSSSSSSYFSAEDRRGRSWAWAFASPIRAFSAKSSTSSKDNRKNATPDLSAIPSLLTVS